MKTFVIILSGLLLLGCKEPPQTTERVGNFKVETLFTHDGCTVYRFYDDRTVYFTKCDGKKDNTFYNESCGKNCTRSIMN